MEIHSDHSATSSRSARHFTSKSMTICRTFFKYKIQCVRLWRSSLLRNMAVLFLWFLESVLCLWGQRGSDHGGVHDSTSVEWEEPSKESYKCLSNKSAEEQPCFTGTQRGVNYTKDKNSLTGLTGFYSCGFKGTHERLSNLSSFWKLFFFLSCQINPFIWHKAFTASSLIKVVRCN